MLKLLKLLLAALFLISCNKNINDPIIEPEETEPEKKDPEYVLYFDFENDPMWQIGPMFQSNFVVEYKENGVEGSKCVNITSSSDNEIFLKKRVSLDPNSVYKISAMVKGENIILNRGNKGGAIGCMPVSNSSYENTTKTFNWIQKECVFTTDISGIAELFMSFAGGGSLGTGKIMFDNFGVEKLNNSEFPVFEGQNIKLILYKEDIESADISNLKLVEWHKRLEQCYNFYSELVGFKPFNGEKITILPSYSVGGWAVAGNPIKWERDCVADALMNIEKFDDWVFGILHEISHDMDLDYWNFDAEAFANFKMMYVLEKTNGKILMGEKLYTGRDLYKLYKTDTGASYDDFMSKGKYSGDSMAYLLYKIKEIVGWDGFKAVFRKLQTNKNFTNRFNRFANLMIELEKISNGKFKTGDVISEHDYKIIQDALKN